MTDRDYCNIGFNHVTFVVHQSQSATISVSRSRNLWWDLLKHEWPILNLKNEKVK